MGRRLRMTGELGDWLAELAESQPATAAEVGAALVAVVDCAAPAGLTIVGAPAMPPLADPREAADVAYQQLLEESRLVRRGAADVAGDRRRAGLRLAAGRAAGADAPVLADLERDLAAAEGREKLLARQSQLLHTRVDEFRTAKETAKALYAAAEASLRIAEAVELFDVAGVEPDVDLARLREDYQAAENRLRALAALPIRTSAQLRDLTDETRDKRPPPAAAGTASASRPAPAASRPAPPPPPAPAAGRPAPPPPQPVAEPVPGLLELRADPLGSDIRVLFAVEPADTVTLLAVLEGAEAIRAHGADATRLAGDLLTEIRDGGWPADIDEVLLADPAEFAATFFPADDGGIARRAGVLAAITSLGRLRADLHVTIEEVAARSGLAVHRVAAIEGEGLRTARVHEAVALARALGARLELTAGSGPVAG